MMRNVIERLAGRRVVGAALLGLVASVAGLAWRGQRLEGMELLDTRGWYTPDDAAALFGALERLDGSAAAVYAITALTIDMLFPVCYGLLFALVLRRLLPGPPLFLVPLALALSDVLENATVAALALSFDGEPSSWAWLAAACTLVKTVLLAATLAAVAAGAALRLSERLRR
ncbi:MAG: hypothetical protein OXI41_03225 [Chloroflexota bacterium]|nr:hypothetical protein [Chloroflexota bacterium]